MMMDDNGFPLMYGLSSDDGVTHVQIKFSSANGGMMIDTTTVLGFTPALVNSQTENDYPIMRGVSSENDTVVLPWYVNPATGAVLVDM